MVGSVKSLSESIVAAKTAESYKRICRDYPEIIDELNKIRNENIKLKAKILEYENTRNTQGNTTDDISKDMSKTKCRGKKNKLDTEA